MNSHTYFIITNYFFYKLFLPYALFYESLRIVPNADVVVTDIVFQSTKQSKTRDIY